MIGFEGMNEGGSLRVPLCRVGGVPVACSEILPAEFVMERFVQGSFPVAF